MNHYLAQANTVDGFPRAVVENPNTGKLGLKPAGEFLNDVIGFIWPRFWFTSLHK